MKYELMIKQFRKLKKITQKELALKTGFHQTYISKLENNEVNHKKPTLDTIVLIAEALEVCPHSLIKFNSKCNKKCICESKIFFKK